MAPLNIWLLALQKNYNEVFTYREVYSIVRWLNQSSFGRRQHMFYMFCSQTTLLSANDQVLEGAAVEIETVEDSWTLYT